MQTKWEFINVVKEVICGYFQSKRSSARNNILISYSPTDYFAANYLKLSLEASELKPEAINRQNRTSLLYFQQDFQHYIGIIPEDYGQPLSTTNQIFESEIQAIFSNSRNLSILLLYSRELTPYTKALIKKIQRKSRKRARFLKLPDLSPIYQLSHNLQVNIMLNQVNPDLESIWTPFTDKLSTVTETTTFSQLYLMMEVLGKRHFPIVDKKTKACVGLISRRDVISRVPPGSTLLPLEVQEENGIEIDSTNLASEVERLSSVKIGDLFERRKLISISPSDSITKVIDLFSHRQLVAGRRIYVGALPVIQGEKLLGLISYEDVLRKFIRDQNDYLSWTVEKVATLKSKGVKIRKVHSEQLLSDAAFQLMDVRSLPVVKAVFNSETEAFEATDDDEIIGFIEDITIKAYTHPAFIEQVSALKLKDLMISLDRLYTPTPGELLRDCIDKLCYVPNGAYGAFPPSSLVVCNTQKGSPKKLEGVLSYVDVFLGWLRYSHDSQHHSAQAVSKVQNSVE